ncbi:MAG: hypothetical protein ABIF19_08165 [Planctomycetota bacterium]
MKRRINSVVKQVMGYLLCICLAGLFMLLMTWLILELRTEPQVPQGVAFGNAYSMAASLPTAGRYEVRQYRARQNEAWRNESLQARASLQAELDWYGGFEYEQPGDEQGLEIRWIANALEDIAEEEYWHNPRLP